MAKYDHGGGCACGLQRYCDCGVGQANGKTVSEEKAWEAQHAAYFQFKKQSCIDPEIYDVPRPRA